MPLSHCHECDFEGRRQTGKVMAREWTSEVGFLFQEIFVRFCDKEIFIFPQSKLDPLNLILLSIIFKICYFH